MFNRLVPSFLAPLVALLVLLASGLAQAQTLSVTDVSQAEGTGGTTTFTFRVTLNAPAGPGGVTFDIATQDNTASASSDYAALSLTSQNISAGSTGPYLFDVTVNGDTTPEPNETFFVNVTNISNGTPGDTQGQGTILNDDPTPIHDIQGPGATSPIVAASVLTRGVVTGVTSNGFFIQEPDATVDADPATSEAIFVFTLTPPPAGVVVSAQVEVAGTVTEFIPSIDTRSPPVTQLTSPTVTVLVPSGLPLPTAVPLTTSFPSPSGPFDQLERVEHMRVSVSSLTVTAPVGGDVDEVNSLGTNTGRFYAVLTGNARPFREAGIQAPDLPPVGAIPPIPRFDTNPERIAVDSDGLAGQPALLVKSGDAVTGAIVGPLTYASRAYTVLPEDSASLNVTAAPPLATTVTAPTGGEFTVASLNLNRLFDTINGPATSDTVVTPAALDRRLAKISLAIRTHLRNPDIIGVQEVETLAALQALAMRIEGDGGPAYQAFLVGGNDVAFGLSSGFLVKTAEIATGVPRVTVNSLTQIGLSSTWIDPGSGSPVLLYERPPLLLDATVNRLPGVTFPIKVLVTDLRNMSSIDDEAPDALSTRGTRVRAWRLAQAADIANIIQLRQASDPAERLVVIGSFNAFDVNDGYVDVVNVIAGTPPPDAETVVPNDGTDLVSPDLTRLIDALPENRYSQIVNGHPAATDHVLVNAALVTDTVARRVERARLGADYAETFRNSDADALRFSDRDPVVAYFQVASFATADIEVTNDAPSAVIAGETLTYSITVSNNGSDPAIDASWTDTLPAGTVFESLSSVAGWSCTTPAVGAHGTITCSNALFAVGTAEIALVVRVLPSVSGGTVLSNTVNGGSTTPDGDSTNNSATATTMVGSAANLSVTATAVPDPTVTPGQQLFYSISATNAGPSEAAVVTITTPIAGPATFLSASVALAPGWSMNTPAVGATGNVVFSKAVMARNETATFLIAVRVGNDAQSGALVSTTTIASATPDAAPLDNTAVVNTTIDGPPTITPIADQTIAEDGTTGPLTFDIADQSVPASDLSVGASSSDMTLVPLTGIRLLGGTGATRTVTVTPAPNAHGGPVTISIMVSDGDRGTTETFTVTVTPVNDAPTIDPIADQTTTVDTPVGPLALTIGDVDNDAATLTLSASSSNPTVVANTDVQFGGAGASRTITVTPRPGQEGETTITITVSDGDQSETASFHLTVGATPTRTYFLAEGATGAFFDEDLVIANPNATAAPVTVTFFREGASAVTETRTVPAHAGLTLRVDSLPGLEATAASVQVTSDSGLPLAVERTQFWGNGGAYGGHTESAVSGPSTRWFFAEGAQGYFDTFVLVANPQATPVDVALTFLREGESAVSTVVQVAAFSRKTVPASTLADLTGRAFAIMVDAPQPVVAERAMYFGNTATHPWSGGAAAAGVTAPSSTWFFAEGATGSFFDTFILLMNPEAEAAQVTMRYLLDDGEIVDVPKTVPGHGRLTVSLDGEADARLRSAAISTLVTSDRPIVAERSVYWPTGEGAQPWGESHTSPGAPAAAPRWALAEGRTGGPLRFHTYILLANPGTQPADVTVRFMADSSAPVVKTYHVPAMSRYTIDATTEAPTLQDRSFITVIESAGNVPIVVERSMYWDGASIPWSGGSNAFATRLP